MVRQAQFLLIFFLGSFSSLGQSNYLQGQLGGLYNIPWINIKQNTGDYQIKSGKVTPLFKIGYAQFNSKDIGFSVGLQGSRKQYDIYQEKRIGATILKSTVTPRYFVLSLPLAFEYRGNLFSKESNTFYRSYFYSLSMGIGFSYIKEISIISRYKGTGSSFQGSINHKDNFSFSSTWGYDVFFHPAYNFRLQDQSYLGIGILFTFSPAEYASLSIIQQKDGKQYEGTFQLKMLNFIGLSLSYTLPINIQLKVNR